jgi:hypothetical protein
MAYRTGIFTFSNNTDALFRAWINEIHTAITAFGWVRTADTGQIDFATVARPAAINTFQGYAIYRMDDALQATAAVFLRIDFGTGSATDAPALKIRLAIGGTDGAGNLTGNVSTSQTLNTSGVGAATPMRTAGSTSSFRMQWGGELSATQTLCFAIERDLDSSGAETSLGVNVLTEGSTTYASQFIETAGGLGTAEARWYAMINGQASQAGRGFVGVGPVRCVLGLFRNPMKTVVLFARGDFATNSTGPIVIYGVSRTYLFMGLTAGLAINTWNANCGIAFLWE